MKNTSENGVPVLKITLLLLFGLLTFGLAPLLVRFATDAEPLALAAMRTGFASLFLFPFWLRRKQLKKQQPQKTDTKTTWLLLFAGIALGLHFTLWIASLHYTSVASASVLVTIHPVMLIVVESLFFKNHFRPLVWLGVLCAFAGSVWLGITNDTQGGVFPEALSGNILAFIAALCFVLYFILGRKIRQQTEWIDYVFYVYSFATITCVLLVVAWVGGIPHISKTAVWIGILLAAGPTILGHGSMNYAVKYVSPTLLSTLVLSEVVVAAAGAFLLFGEIPALQSVLAMLVIIFGVSLTWSRRQGKRPSIHK